MTTPVFLLARLLLGVPFILWGFGKMSNPAGIGAGLANMGMPAPELLGFLVGLCEFVGGVAVVVGYPVRIVGLLLAIWCLLTGFMVHVSSTNELYDHIVMAGGFLLLSAAGPGPVSLFNGNPPAALRGLR